MAKEDIIDPFSEKPKYMEKIKSTLLNNQKIIEETKKEIKICLETNDNKNTTQNQWNAVKAELRENLIAIRTNPKKQHKHKISNLIVPLKQQEKGPKIPKIIEERNDKDQSINNLKIN